MSIRVPTINESHEPTEDFESSSKVNSAVPFVRPKLVRKGSEVESRLLAMRERFTMIQMMEEIDKTDSFDKKLDSVDSPLLAANKDSPAATISAAASRWKRLRKVVNWPAEQHGTDSAPAGVSSRSNFALGVSSSPQISPRLSPRLSRKSTALRPQGSTMSVLEPESRKSSGGDSAIGLEDVSLTEFWANEDIPEVPFDFDEKNDLPSLSLLSDAEIMKAEIVSDLFNNDSKQLSLTVSRVPEEVVAEREAEIEKQAAEERHIMLDKLKKKEEDVKYREEHAKDDLKEREQEARRRLDAEKQKVASLALRKQRNLTQDFKRIREELEAGVKRQQGTVKEHFGKLLIHEEVRGCFVINGNCLCAIDNSNCFNYVHITNCIKFICHILYRL